MRPYLTLIMILRQELFQSASCFVLLFDEIEGQYCLVVKSTGSRVIQTLLYLKKIFVLATPQGIWDLSSLTRDQICTSCIESLGS